MSFEIRIWRRANVPGRPWAYYTPASVCSETAVSGKASAEGMTLDSAQRDLVEDAEQSFRTKDGRVSE